LIHFYKRDLEIRALDTMEKASKNDSAMLLVRNRLATFKNWPFSEEEGSDCTPARMAEAGFYACGGDNEPDLARCYFCRKELDGWDPEDDPWAEHVSHAKGKCAFVNLGKKASELTVADVLGVLEPAKNRMVLTKVEEMWEAQFNEEATATRREIDNLAPKSG